MKSCNILNDRILWFNGSSTINPLDVYDYIPFLNYITVTELTSDIERYNSNVVLEQQINVVDPTKYDDFTITPNWKLPLEYQNISIIKYINIMHERLRNEMHWSEDEWKRRQDRLMYEYNTFIEKGYTELLRTLICIINTMVKNNIVWGTGRGSSVSSYLLYVIQLHDVDSHLYEINFSDFIK